MAAARLTRERWLYFVLVLAVAASVVLGFTQTYLTRAQLLDDPGSLPVAVHVHGASFLAWYGLAVVQAALVLGKNLRWHRWLGWSSLALAAVMVLSGLLVVAVRMAEALREGQGFWFANSLGILATLILFTGYFAAAIRWRKRPDLHRRHILLAGATGSGAAQFRTIEFLVWSSPWSVALGLASSLLFVVAAMLGERAISGRVPLTYRRALPLALLFDGVMLLLPYTAFGPAIEVALVDLVRPAFGFYGPLP